MINRTMKEFPKEKIFSIPFNPIEKKYKIKKSKKIFFLYPANYWKHKFNMEICTENGFIELNGLVTPSKTYAPEVIKYALKNKKTGQINKFQKKTFYKDNSFEIETLNFIKLIKLPKNSSYNFSMDSLSLMKTIDQVYKKDISIRN